MAVDPWAEFEDADTAVADPWAEFEDAPEVAEAPEVPLTQKLFPATTERFRNPPTQVGGSIGGTIMDVANDVLDIPTRFAAQATGQKMEDPNAYALRGSVEGMYEEGAPARRGLPPKPVGEFIGRAVSDPLSFAGLGKTAARGIVKGGEAAMDAGKNVLRRAIKPSRPSMRAWNPPDFEIPLREKLVTKFGGLEKAGQNIQGAVDDAAGAKEALLASAKIRIAGSGAIEQARKSVISKVGRGEGLSAVEVKQIPQYMDEAFETAQSYPSFRGQKNGWSLSGQDAVEFRKWMDKQTTFDRAKDAPPRAEFYRNLRRAFEDQIDTRMGQSNVAARAGANTQTQYQATKKQLADLMPIKKAFEERLLQDPNNYAIGLRETALLGGAIASGNFGAATAKTGIGVAINRLLNRPGGAAILYELGESMAEPGPMKTLLLTAAATGKISGVANRLLDALAVTQDEERKEMLENRLMKELGSSFEAKK